MNIFCGRCPCNETDTRERPELVSSARLAPSDVVMKRVLHDAAETFEVLLDLENPFCLGIGVSSAGRICMVDIVEDGGSVGDYNSFAAEALQVRECDRILAINGETASKGSELLERIRDISGIVELRIQRPTLVKLTVQRDGTDPLMGLSLKAGPYFLTVMEVMDGPVMAFNVSSVPEKRINSCSCILSINGLRGTGNTLLEILRTSWSQEISIEAMSWPEDDMSKF
eukprot:TRINITY_DN37767_c0_g1_i1.p1 TRINITY_DN37767_c0_g1~~TRINITY_DN37767_c0_g1_i1.p1  ORF type:complete len:227 (+),score=38.38 TRINITY_DN37767_c0_g1_i1:99-779(+)